MTTTLNLTGRGGRGARGSDAQGTLGILLNLPRDPFCVWSFDQYDAASATIPNLVAGMPPLSCGAPAGGIYAGSGAAHFSAVQTMRNITVSAFVKQTSFSAYNGIIIAGVNSADYASFYFGPNNNVSGSGSQPASLKGVNSPMNGNYGGLFNLSAHNARYPITMTQNNIEGTQQLFVGDIRLVQGADQGAFSFQDLSINMTPDTHAPMFSMSGFIAIYDRALSDAEIRLLNHQQRLVSQRAGATANIVAARDIKAFIAEGHSIEGGYDSNGWPYQYGILTNNFGAVYSISGSTLADLVARAANLKRAVPPSLGNRKFPITIGIGTNDLQAYPGGTAAYITAYRAYVKDIASTGAYILLKTILPRGDLTAPNIATFNAMRAVMNTDIRNNFALYGASDVIDDAADAQLGADNSQTAYPALWLADKLHPSAAGQTIMRDKAAAKLTPLLT